MEPVRVEADPVCEGLTTAGYVADPEDCSSYFQCVGDGRVKNLRSINKIKSSISRLIHLFALRVPFSPNLP